MDEGRGDTDAAVVAYRGEAARPLVHRRQLPRPHPAHGLVHGTREGSFVRLAGGRGDSPDQSEFDSVAASQPPSYPHEIDRELAERGRRLFYSKSVGCSRCHGVYDGRGNVDWPGVHKDVGTDPARRDIVSDGFRAAFASSPLAAEGALVKSEG